MRKSVKLLTEKEKEKESEKQRRGEGEKENVCIFLHTPALARSSFCTLKGISITVQYPGTPRVLDVFILSETDFKACGYGDSVILDYS